MARPELKRAIPYSPKSDSSSATPQSSRALVILAFAAVYLIWGSTYLAIRYAIETVPPFLMAASRFLIAGTILFIWAAFRDSVRPSFSDWRRAFIVGALLLLCGNGGVTWSEKYIPSGLAALLVATEPLWVVLLNWAISHKRPNAKVFLGVLIGLAGVALLVSSGLKGGNASALMTFVSIAVVIAAGLAWAGGSVYSNRRPINAPIALASAMQMLAGGCLLLLLGIVTGDFYRLNLSKTSWVSIGALGYLILFGSLVAFTAYSWLLRKVSTAKAATYAYVNPVVAVFLGWLIASEPITLRMSIGAAVIVGSVVLITTYGTDEKKSSDRSDSQSSNGHSESIQSTCPAHPCA